MNYKIKITADNQAIVKRIADENGMNKYNYLFKNYGQFYIIINNKFDNIFLDKSDCTELTTEQFIELFDKKETELNKWLKETKAKDLSRWQLQNEIDLIMDKGVLMQLQGSNNYTKAEILFNQWNNPTEESLKAETEWQPKRGDRVLVWDGNEKNAKIRIFLTKIEGSTTPIVVVYSPDEESFLNNEEFDTTEFKHMKPLPIEQPKETDFKSKFEAAIELIEEHAKEQTALINIHVNDCEFENASKAKLLALKLDSILNQIKEL